MGMSLMSIYTSSESAGCLMPGVMEDGYLAQDLLLVNINEGPDSTVRSRFYSRGLEIILCHILKLLNLDFFRGRVVGIHCASRVQV